MPGPDVVLGVSAGLAGLGCGVQVESGPRLHYGSGTPGPDYQAVSSRTVTGEVRFQLELLWKRGWGLVIRDK